MRTVCFVDRIEVDFHGTIFHEALSVGDVDNDSHGELVVGNTNGDLVVFKGNLSEPWKQASGLGMITCIEVGDVCNIGKNSVVVMTAEAHCHIFDVETDVASKVMTGTDTDTRITPVFTQTVPANSKSMILADADQDGRIELIVAYSDRVVRSFRWTRSSDAVPASGQLQQLEKWQLAGQVGALTTNRCSDGGIDLMASQPGGTFVTLLPARTSRWTESSDSDTLDNNVPALVYHPLSLSSRARSSSVTTEMVGCLTWTEGAALYALTTLDGTIMLVDNDQIIWSMQVDHQLFSLNKIDVTGDGIEELVICAWDGQTYIIDHNRDVVKYQFEENVAAFACGMYGLSDGRSVQCFVYATLNDKIYIYHNLGLSNIRSQSLLHMTDKQPLQTLTQMLGVHEDVSCGSVSSYEMAYRIKSLFSIDHTPVDVNFRDTEREGATTVPVVSVL